MVKELEQRQKVRRAVYSWPSLILMGLITVFLAKGAAGIFAIERQNAQRVEVLEAQSEALVLREKDLKLEIDRLYTDEGKIEAIKEKFSATREGEFVAVIVDERRKATTTGGKEEIWYKKFWSAIMRK
jgi:cell division protein FtsB